MQKGMGFSGVLRVSFVLKSSRVKSFLEDEVVEGQNILYQIEKYWELRICLSSK